MKRVVKQRCSVVHVCGQGCQALIDVSGKRETTHPPICAGEYVLPWASTHASPLVFLTILNGERCISFLVSSSSKERPMRRFVAWKVPSRLVTACRHARACQQCRFASRKAQPDSVSAGASQGPGAMPVCASEAAPGSNVCVGVCVCVCPKVRRAQGTWRFAGMPTSFSPSAVNATTLGVVRVPSWFSMTRALAPSITATHELVVPRSIPMMSPALAEAQRRWPDTAAPA